MTNDATLLLVGEPGSCCHGPTADDEYDQCPLTMAKTSVLPSLSKSPKRSCDAAGGPHGLGAFACWMRDRLFPLFAPLVARVLDKQHAAQVV